MSDFMKNHEKLFNLAKTSNNWNCHTKRFSPSSFQQKVHDSIRFFKKNMKNSSISPKLATFPTNCHVVRFLPSSLQQKNPNSVWIEKEHQKLLHLAKTSNFSNKMQLCRVFTIQFSSKKLQNSVWSLKSMKNSLLGQNCPGF